MEGVAEGFFELAEAGVGDAVDGGGAEVEASFAVGGEGLCHAGGEKVHGAEWRGFGDVAPVYALDHARGVVVVDGGGDVLALMADYEYASPDESANCGGEVVEGHVDGVAFGAVVDADDAVCLGEGGGVRGGEAAAFEAGLDGCAVFPAGLRYHAGFDVHSRAEGEGVEVVGVEEPASGAEGGEVLLGDGRAGGIYVGGEGEADGCAGFAAVAAEGVEGLDVVGELLGLCGLDGGEGRGEWGVEASVAQTENHAEARSVLAVEEGHIVDVLAFGAVQLGEGHGVVDQRRLGKEPLIFFGRNPLSIHHIADKFQ